MQFRGNSFRAFWRFGLAAAAMMLAACDAVNEAIDEIDDVGNTAEVFYYLSLGDSLAVGVQPNGVGAALPTDDGYADQLFDLIRPAFEAAGQNRELRLVKLGCPGATVDDMLNGGGCVYVAGSQLAAAVDFLEDNGNKVVLVTIDIGGNDFRDENCLEAAIPVDCATTVSTKIANDLAAVLNGLQAVADPATTIAGMNYYNPYLAAWLEGEEGQVLARQSADAVAVLNEYLVNTYTSAGATVAHVAAAFESDDFGTLVPSSQPPPNDMLPTNVNNICEFTYMCDPDVGPDIHANTAGYALIAATFEEALP